MKEKNFKKFLVKYLEARGAKCWIHEGDWHRKFTISNIRQYPDIYCRTKIEEFPSICIETKLSNRLGNLTKGFFQVQKYISNLYRASYKISNKEVDPPSLILIATPFSVSRGILYLWNNPSFKQKYEAAKGITEFVDRILWKINSAILRNGYFCYKQRNYYF